MRGVNIKPINNTLYSRTPTPKPFLPPDLSKSEKRLEVRSDAVYVYRAYVEARDPHDLNKLSHRRILPQNFYLVYNSTESQSSQIVE